MLLPDVTQYGAFPQLQRRRTGSAKHHEGLYVGGEVADLCSIPLESITIPESILLEPDSKSVSPAVFFFVNMFRIVAFLVLYKFFAEGVLPLSGPGLADSRCE